MGEAWDCEVQMGHSHISISWPYVDAKTCSVNHCYTRTRKGGRALRKKAKKWRDNLALQMVAALKGVANPPSPPITIYLHGHFAKKRKPPDLSNLHKLIGDAVQAATGINDREFRWHDLGYRVGGSAKEAFLRITIRWGGGR